MSLSQTDYFDANLPGASQTVRIASLYDAKVFVCRWIIRDKDPALKALLRQMEKAKELYDDGKCGPAIDPGTRYTRTIGYAKFVVRDVDDLVTSASDAVDGCAGDWQKAKRWKSVEVRHGEEGGQPHRPR